MRRLIAALPVLLLLSACAGKGVGAQRQFFAMDTVMTVAAHGEGAEEAAGAAQAEINRLEGLLSRTRPDSEISALNAAAPEGVSISEDTRRVLELAAQWSKKTGGAFDVTIAPVVSAWGFAGSGEYRAPAPEELKRLLALADGGALRVEEGSAALGRPGMEVDLGAVAKGYAAARAEQVLREHGVESALLNLGGNVTAVGSKPGGAAWRVAVQDPADSGGTVGVLSLRNCTAATSGGYQRYFEQDGQVYHHIIDPRTGYPARSGLLSATAVCADAALADILSTAAFVLGEEDALALRRAEGGFELVLVTGDGRVVVTNGLSGLFQPEQGAGYAVEYAQ